MKGSLFQLIGKWAGGMPNSLIPTALLKPIAPARYRLYLQSLSGAELAQCSAITLLTLGLLLASLLTERFAEWLALWFLPINVAGLILPIFFQWLPHHPFHRTDRCGNTRLSLWTGAGS